MINRPLSIRDSCPLFKANQLIECPSISSLILLTFIYASPNSYNLSLSPSLCQSLSYILVTIAVGYFEKGQREREGERERIIKQVS